MINNGELDPDFEKEISEFEIRLDQIFEK